MGMVIFGAGTLYLLILILGITWAARSAKRKGKNPWLWGAAAGLAIYLPVFWDHIPTIAIHNYYCEKDAGFLVNKTVTQWKEENPGVVETLVPVKGAPSTRQGRGNNYIDTYPLNERFLWRVKKEGPYLLHGWRHEQEVIDAKTSEILARYVDFSTGYGAVERGEGWSALKFWLWTPHCKSGASNRGKMEQFMLQAKDPA